MTMENVLMLCKIVVVCVVVAVTLELARDVYRHFRQRRPQVVEVKHYLVTRDGEPVFFDSDVRWLDGQDEDAQPTTGQ